MTSSAPAHQRVRRRFREQAQAFDDLYEDERPLVRRLRPGLFRRRSLAVDTVRCYAGPRVLDVGCGSGRIGEFVLEAGARRYVGVDFSEPMIGLAKRRLERFAERVELILDDFLDASIAGSFDVVLALGLFDYLPDPHRYAHRMFELCAARGCVVGSFPTWSLVKGPVRKVRYEWIGDCPIFNYSRRELELMFGSAGFDPVEIIRPGQSGHLVRAYHP
ncbi:MAG: methyltransferase domain-containing protein [Solirubrobacterales bacterium]|nr:methyltransferase domain-containing protein [Solirubrobacterales bacterium]MBV9717470.1 methyltransferase domain-containing protein [Solirubrobacterales bacterium]